MPLNETAVAPVRFVPVMTTLAADGALPGLNVEIVGARNTVKLPLDVTLPPGVVTDTVPLVVPDATTAVICVLESTVNWSRRPIPLRRTAVAPVKFVPVIITVEPIGPLVGVKLEMVGAGMTVNEPLDVALPPDVVTATVPVVAPTGTAAVTCVAETTLKLVAAVPLNATAVAP